MYARISSEATAAAEYSHQFDDTLPIPLPQCCISCKQRNSPLKSLRPHRSAADHRLLRLSSAGMLLVLSTSAHPRSIQHFQADHYYSVKFPVEKVKPAMIMELKHASISCITLALSSQRRYTSAKLYYTFSLPYKSRAASETRRRPGNQAESSPTCDKFRSNPFSAKSDQC